MRFYLLLILFSQTFLFAQEPAQEPLKKAGPKGLFTVMPWNFQGRMDLAYAPWGNFGEGNATIIPLTVFPGAPSAKCAYYTNGKLTLLRQKASEQTGTGLPVYEKVTDVTLPIKAGRISDYLLLVTPPTAQRPTWSVTDLDFDRQTLPPGKFTFSSRVSQPISLAFGESSFSLAPNSAKTIEGKMKEGGRTIELSIKLGSRLLFSQQWPHVSALRGLFFVSSGQNGLEVTRFVDLPRPVEQALGYGVAPITKLEEDEFQPEEF